MNMKPVIVIGVIVLLFPVVVALWPKPLTTGDVRQALEAAGLTVEGYNAIAQPELDAVEHVTMVVEGARVNVYRYDDVGKLARHLEYQSSGVSPALSALSIQMGAAQPKFFTSAARNGKLMMTATSENQVLNQRLVGIFRGL